VYGSGRTGLVAVDHLSLGIPEGECFGLLGINGAGKTTTFKMLSGDYTSTSGTAYLDGFNINTMLRKVFLTSSWLPLFSRGYCGQINYHIYCCLAVGEM